MKPPLALLLASALVVAASCRSAAEHKTSADEEVYAIVSARRAELGAGVEFTIEPPADSLRARVIAAQESGEPLEIPALGFVECLEIAAESSREYQDRREDLYLAALDLTLDRWAFGVQETATVDTLVTGVDGEADTLDVGGDLTLSRLFGSGALVVGSIGLDLFKALSGGSWTSISDVSLRVTQPLLRGFGAEIVMEPLTQAERNVVYEVRSYERFRRTLAFDVASQMFRIAQQVDTLANERQNQASLILIRERNEALAEAGQLLDIEVDQARQNELRAETRVVEALRTLEGLYDDFKLFLGLPLDTPLTIRVEELGTLFGISVPEASVDEDLATKVALARRLDHLTTVDRVNDAQRRLVIAEDQLGAGLELEVNAGAASDVDSPLDYEDSVVPWDIRLDLDLPIDRLIERNEYRAAMISLAAAQRSAFESRDFVHADVRDALRALEAAREQVAIQAQSVLLAERRVESSQMQQQAGRADTRDLLESQEALLEANNAAVQAEVDHALARLALYRDMELLRVDERGLWVDPEPLTSETE